MRRPADLSAAEFRRQLAQQGFSFLPLSVEFVDRWNRGGPRIAAIKRGRGIDRRATLEALQAARAAAQAREAAVEAKRAERERTAAAIAPHVLPPCRADLDGAAAIAQLADDFLIGTTLAEGISFKSLIYKGWRAAQLRAYADEARSVADRRQSLQSVEVSRKLFASVTGVVAFREDLGGIFCAAVGLDLASVHSAPFDECVGVYLNLFAKCALRLVALDNCGHPLQPVVIVGLEIGIDGKPSGPVLFAHPRNGHSNHLRHLNKSCLSG